DAPTLKKELSQQAETLKLTLNSFGIEAKVGHINCGPTITSFEVHPPTGVKVQKISALQNDIALNLEAKSIRIIAPIPGKAAVGVEVPSPYPQEVGFKEMLQEYRKGQKNMVIPILLGQTVTGENIVTDLTKMPHAIIAGATGSGKSVCINSIVMSLLMSSRPDEVRLILVDPKKVELSAYSNLPHMITPVITEAHGAYAALNWLVQEMQCRYEILKKMGLRNITSFNRRKRKRGEEEEGIPNQMPYFVTIIDEFADLMMASSSDLETPIARIAQMARAVGIHLILATQRPSREVITGLIKANFPSRIAFKVASRTNSQIILDENGAESLLGNGDMLFLPPGSSQLIRSQGVFIRDEDIHRVIQYIERQAPTEYLISSFDSPEIPCHQEDPIDPLYKEAYDIVIETGNASTTFLQRRLKIGYARAGALMDALEERGVVGKQEGSRPREILKFSPNR
ncbi:MAG: DNA translocase FtsK, partial [Chlamydiota bacterium]|nr:DNA translocase FtsK [Chlamydiota bacterium]